MLQTKPALKINIHILWVIIFFLESVALYEIMWTNTVEPQVTDYNTAHAHFMLDIKVYKHTLLVYNTSCSFTATMVTGTRLIVTLYLHYLPCLFILWPSGL